MHKSAWMQKSGSKWMVCADCADDEMLNTLGLRASKESASENILNLLISVVHCKDWQGKYKCVVKFDVFSWFFTPQTSLAQTLPCMWHTVSAHSTLRASRLLTFGEPVLAEQMPFKWIGILTEPLSSGLIELLNTRCIANILVLNLASNSITAEWNLTIY